MGEIDNYKDMETISFLATYLVSNDYHGPEVYELDLVVYLLVRTSIGRFKQRSSAMSGLIKS
jgi:hypothetical protein